MPLASDSFVADQAASLADLSSGGAPSPVTTHEKRAREIEHEIEHEIFESDEVEEIRDLIEDDVTEEIDAAFTFIGDNGVMWLTDALKENQTLKRLCFKATGISDTGTKDLVQALMQNRSLESIDLSNPDSSLQDKFEFDVRPNWVSRDGAKALAEFSMANDSLHTLCLCHTWIKDEGAKSFAHVIYMKDSLKELFLDHCGISNVGAKAFALALATKRSTQYLLTSWARSGSGLTLARNNSLQLLSLCGNALGDEGVIALAAALKWNGSLHTLRLGRTGIGTDNGNGALKSLGEALKVNQFLLELDLRSNGIDDKGSAALADALTYNESLQILSLHDNKIRSKGAVCLAKAIADARALKSLDLGENSIGAEGSRALANALVKNSSFERLDFSGNTKEGSVALAILRPDCKRVACNDKLYSIAQSYAQECQRRRTEAVVDIPEEILYSGLAVVRKYFNDLANGTSSLAQLRVLLVGPQGSGKTSLANCLASKGMTSDLTMKGPDRATISVDIRKLKFDTGGHGTIPGEVSLWDFGGQQEYYMTHSLFISSRSLVVLVMDLNAYRDSDEYFENTAGRWLRALAVQTSRVHLVIVGTKSDLVSKSFAGPSSEDRLRKIMDRVAVLRRGLRALCEMTFAPLKKSFILSNETPDGVEDLYNMLHTFTCDPKYRIALRLPKPYVALRNMLFDHVLPREPKVRDMRVTVRNVSNVRRQMKALGYLSLDGNEDFERALQLLNDLGQVVWCSQNPNLAHLVFTDPVWLVDVVRSVFRHDLFLNPETGERGVIYKIGNSNVPTNFANLRAKKLEVGQKRLEQECVLTDALLDQIPISPCRTRTGPNMTSECLETWSDLGDDKQTYLEFFMEHDLLFTLPSRTSGLDLGTEYMVPLLFQSNFPRVYKDEYTRKMSRTLASTPCPDSAILHWHCEFDLVLPRSLFLRLASRCYRVIKNLSVLDEFRFTGTTTVKDVNQDEGEIVSYFAFAQGYDLQGSGRLEIKAWSSSSDKSHRFALFDSFSVVLRHVDVYLQEQKLHSWGTQLFLSSGGKYGILRELLESVAHRQVNKTTRESEVILSSVNIISSPYGEVPQRHIDAGCSEIVQKVARTRIAPVSSLLTLAEPTEHQGGEALWSFKYRVRRALKTLLARTDVTPRDMLTEAVRYLLSMLRVRDVSRAAVHESASPSAFGLHEHDVQLWQTLKKFVKLIWNEGIGLDEAREMTKAVAIFETRMRTDRDVFLSHSWNNFSGEHEEINHACVGDLSACLEREGIRTWFDGRDLKRKNMVDWMASGIDDSHVVMFCLTPNFMDKLQVTARRNYCKLEYNYAIHRKDTGSMEDTIIRAHMTETETISEQGAPDLVGRIWVDLSSTQKIQENLDYLVERILTEIFPYDESVPRKELLKWYPAGSLAYRS